MQSQVSELEMALNEKEAIIEDYAKKLHSQSARKACQNDRDKEIKLLKMEVWK